MSKREFIDASREVDTTSDYEWHRWMSEMEKEKGMTDVALEQHCLRQISRNSLLFLGHDMDSAYAEFDSEFPLIAAVADRGYDAL